MVDVYRITPLINRSYQLLRVEHQLFADTPQLNEGRHLSIRHADPQNLVQT